MMLLESQWLPARYRRARWDRHDFVPMEKLHDGAHSLVYQVRDKITGDVLCLKVYKKSALSPVEMRCVHRELRIHTQIHHQHAVQGYAAWEDSSYYNLVMEFAPEGNLFQEVHRRGGFLPENTTVNQVILPLLSCLSYLHSKGIIHRDLKPENMMFMKCGKDRLLKLADFGLSINCWQEAATTCAGTVDYMAPEVVTCPPQSHEEAGLSPEYARYNQAVDVWAIGILVYEMMVGAPPFEDAEGPQGTARNILEAEPQFDDVLSEEAKDFIRRTLAKDPSCRPNMAQLMGHPWIQAHSTSMSTRYTGAPIAAQLKRLPSRQHSWHGQRPSPFAALEHTRDLSSIYEQFGGCRTSDDTAVSSSGSAGFAPSTSQMHASCSSSVASGADGYQSLSALAAQGAFRCQQQWQPLPVQSEQMRCSTTDRDSAMSYPSLAQGVERFTRRDDSAAGFQLPQMTQKHQELDNHPSLETLLLNSMSNPAHDA